jgi:hypothetical protein
MSMHDRKSIKEKLLVGLALGVLLLVVCSIYWVLTRGAAWFTSQC